MPINATALVGAFLSISANLIPLAKMPDVIKTRDERFINLPLAVAIVINFLIWTTYALLIGDVVYLVCQMIGTICGTIQILMYMWASKVITQKDSFFLKMIIKFFSNFTIESPNPDLK